MTRLQSWGHDPTPEASGSATWRPPWSCSVLSRQPALRTPYSLLRRAGGQWRLEILRQHLDQAPRAPRDRIIVTTHRAGQALRTNEFQHQPAEFGVGVAHGILVSRAEPARRTIVSSVCTCARRPCARWRQPCDCHDQPGRQAGDCGTVRRRRASRPAPTPTSYGVHQRASPILWILRMARDQGA